MPSLRELQQGFVGDLLTSEPPQSLPWIGGHGLAPAERLQIYRNNCRIGFHDAVAVGFPVLRALVGDDYFRQLAREYQAAHPSPSGNLAHAGRDLPAFLERRYAGTEFDYFSHVARLEWAAQEVLLAADHAPLDLERLALVPPAEYAELRFELHPAIRLVQSTWPVVTLWEAHQPGRDPEGLDLSIGGEQGVVRRGNPGIEIFRLPAAEYAALRAFRDARTLTVAVDEALGVDADFAPGAALQRWARHGFIVNFSIVGATLAC